MLTLGSQQRSIDFETEWRRKMHVFLDPAHASKKAKGTRNCQAASLFVAALLWQPCLKFKSKTYHACRFGTVVGTAAKIFRLTSL